MLVGEHKSPKFIVTAAIRFDTMTFCKMVNGSEAHYAHAVQTRPSRPVNVLTDFENTHNLMVQVST